jgi:hypothetical protein
MTTLAEKIKNTLITFSATTEVMEREEEAHRALILFRSKMLEEQARAMVALSLYPLFDSDPFLEFVCWKQGVGDFGYRFYEGSSDVVQILENISKQMTIRAFPNACSVKLTRAGSFIINGIAHQTTTKSYYNDLDD